MAQGAGQTELLFGDPVGLAQELSRNRRVNQKTFRSVGQR
jgi:hypothetical protein